MNPSKDLTDLNGTTNANLKRFENRELANHGFAIFRESAKLREQKP
jgi:hypothetical protein